jgi:hypothetical protein
VTIGIPAFFLALGPSTGPYRVKGFLREVARFAFPAGTAAGLGVLASYLFALNVARIPLVEARTIATSVLVIVGLYLILALEWSGPRRGAAIATLCGVLLFLYVLVLVAPGGREFFDLALPGPGGWFIILFGAAVAIAGLWLTDDRFIPGRGAALAET